MTTTPDHHEPLDDEQRSEEERDLAARLGRIGPFDGPSPALDAKILAAAHAAAVARAPGRRRLAWLGVPPALVTGVGVAAAAVLALGLVWQLRPRPGMVTAQGEADAGEEVILIAEPAGVVRAPALNPPPLPDEAPAAAASGRAQPVIPPATPAPVSRDSAKAVAAPAPAAMAEEAAAVAAQAASAAEEKRETETAAREAAADSGFVAEPPATATPARRNHATYTTGARARAEQRERAAGNAAAAPPAPASVPSASEAAPASAAASAEAQTLDRIEVTGSRIRQDRDWSQVPVSDDTRLPAADWLERIRARRDGDDIDNARASLQRFQREYPRVRVPDDLRELLADTKR
jgi:hypothetical protein